MQPAEEKAAFVMNSFNPKLAYVPWASSSRTLAAPPPARLRSLRSRALHSYTVADVVIIVCSEIEDKTQKERQERQNAASLKESEMKQEAAAALEKFHADRKAAAAAKLEENLCALVPPLPLLAIGPAALGLLG